MDSPLGIIINMITTVILNGMGTLKELFGLFLNLLESLGFVTRIGGLPLFIASVVVIALVVYFLGKLFFNIGKQMIILFVIGGILVWIIILSVV